MGGKKKDDEKDQVEAGGEETEAVAASETGAAGAGNNPSAATDNVAGDGVDAGGAGNGDPIEGDKGVAVDGQAAETAIDAGEGETAQGAADPGQADDHDGGGDGGETADPGGAEAATGIDPDAGAVDPEWPLDADAPSDRLRGFSDVNVLTALAHLAVTMQMPAEVAGNRLAEDRMWFENISAGALVANAAAAFLRQWPDGSPEAIVIHLRRSGLSVPKPGPREIVAWLVFAFTLSRLDQLDREEEARRKAEEWANEERGPVTARREDLAMMPAEDNPLSDLGRAVEQRG